MSGTGTTTVYDRLVRRGLMSSKRLQALEARAADRGTPIEVLLLADGIPKHELLFCLAAKYHAPFIEFDESVIASYFLVFRLDMEHLKKALWFPLSLRDGRAEVIAFRPDDPRVVQDIEQTLGAKQIEFRIALPADLIRIIEHNFDVNARFFAAGGRTPLARVRTLFAYRRSTYAHFRTLFAKGRTGLAFLRTGIAFIVIALLFLRLLGPGWYLLLEGPLLIAGLIMAYDGVKWYLPARAIAGKPVDASLTKATWGTTVLNADLSNGPPIFSRTDTVTGAAELRDRWEDLSPVMRRRFLASDRTDMAEERTSLAGQRTMLARARTGLAFARTGIAFAGLGIGLLRQFHAGWWTILDSSLILIGSVMFAEGLHWYFGGRKAGLDGFRFVREVVNKESIWDMAFPAGHRRERRGPPVSADQRPGIWATTGVALERTVLADRRGVMARLRTVMAVARTGMAYVRTGMSIASVGAVLQVYFGTASAAWTAMNVLLITGGLALIVDGFFWSVPAERMRRQYPYCYGDMEITLPDYGRPVRTWGTVIFNQYEK